jgi:hypothetical protein
MTTTQLSDRTNISVSLIRQLVREGRITPLSGGGYGRGNVMEWSEDAVAQLEAYKQVRYWLGDGQLAKFALEGISRVTRESDSLVFNTPQGQLATLTLSAMAGV